MVTGGEDKWGRAADASVEPFMGTSRDRIADLREVRKKANPGA
jgi:hypothetical protein